MDTFPRLVARAVPNAASEVKFSLRPLANTETGATFQRIEMNIAALTVCISYAECCDCKPSNSNIINHAELTHQRPTISIDS